MEEPPQKRCRGAAAAGIASILREPGEAKLA